MLRAQIQDLGVALELFRRQERMRAWATPGLSARQAAGHAAKVAYVLAQARPFAADIEPTIELHDSLERALGRLLYASAQSWLGRRLLPEPGGARVRGYFSEIDCVLQPYSLSIPDDYDPAVKWPLFVALHGHDSFRPFQGHPAPGFAGAFCVAPHARGATDYRDLGEHDVLRVIDEVCLDFSIDQDRVFVFGSSMGGTGAWHLGAHYADRFAGIMPVSGNSDYRAWSACWGWNRSFPGRLDTLRDWLQESHTARAYASNLLSLPVYAMHGSADREVPPQHSRLTVAALRAAGANVEYREFPKCGHDGFPESSTDAGLAWLAGWSRNAFPRRVSWRAALLKHGAAYWVRMTQFDRPCRFGTIEATATDDRHVTITTGNVLELQLLRTPRLFRADRPLFVSIDDERVIFPPSSVEDAWLTLRRADDGGWRDASAGPEPVGLRKRPGLEGPISEALTQPFVVVYGTMSSDPLTRALWRNEAWAFASEWQRRNGWFCPIVSDTQCTDEMARTRNLILFGGSADNLLAARLGAGLPTSEILRTAAERLPVDRFDLMGKDLAEAADVGLFLVYPNPFHPDRLVVVVSAGGAPAVHQAWKRFGNWFNWGVFDSKKYFDYAVFDSRTVSPESYLLLGYFGSDWGLDSGVSFEGNAAVRETLAPQQFPRHWAVPKGSTDVQLVDVRPAMIDQMRGSVGFGRSYHGAALDRGLGIRAPSVLAYRTSGGFRRLRAGARLLGDPNTCIGRLQLEQERVLFVVSGDGQPLATAVASWEAPVLELDVDITGVDVLQLEAHVVGGPGWLHGGAAWLVPTLVR